MANEKLVHGDNASAFQTVFTSATLTTTTAGSAIPGIEKYSSAIFFAKVSAVSGTSPTFDISIQTLLPDGAPGAGSGTWQAIANFAQATTTANRVLYFVPGAASEAATATSVTAATIKAFGLGVMNRVNVVVGGTNPSGVVVVYAHYFV